jgi:hypothetical protein
MIEVQIKWGVNPFRGDKFAAGWRPAAEAALDYGATSWSLVRTLEGGLDFVQSARFPSKEHFERYWYSEEISSKRVEMARYYQVPLLPTFWSVVGSGELVEEEPAAPAASG